MDIEELIESIHTANAARRKAEQSPFGEGQGSRNSRSGGRVKALRIALPAAAAAMLLLILWPRGGEAQAATPSAGIYCNSQCNPDDVLALIDNNINHIKQIQAL